MCSKWCAVKLGDDDSRSESCHFSWFSMLISTGFGMEILFFGVGEPVFCFGNSGTFGYPNNPHADRQGHAEMTVLRAVDAMRVT